MIVRTVLGDIDPGDLGVTLGHEHLHANPPEFITDDDLRFGDVERMTGELVDYREVGGSGVIEMTTPDYGRDGRALLELSRRTGVHVIAATGFNKAKFAERLCANATVEDLAERFTREVTTGLAECRAVRAGLVKASSSLNGPTPSERKVFRAVARTHLATNAPISTHTEKGTWAHGQLDLFEQEGVPPGRVLLGHLDLNPDLALLLDVAARGCFLGFDQFGKVKYLPDEGRVDLVVKLCEAGRSGQLVLSGDMARRSSFRFGGGPGLRHVPLKVAAMLQGAGLSEVDVNAILVDNPRRFLSFKAEVVA